jgi:hypothetical protein
MVVVERQLFERHPMSRMFRDLVPGRADAALRLRPIPVGEPLLHFGHRQCHRKEEVAAASREFRSCDGGGSVRRLALAAVESAGLADPLYILPPRPKRGGPIGAQFRRQFSAKIYIQMFGTWKALSRSLAAESYWGAKRQNSATDSFFRRKVLSCLKFVRDWESGWLASSSSLVGIWRELLGKLSVRCGRRCHDCSAAMGRWERGIGTRPEQWKHRCSAEHSRILLFASGKSTRQLWISVERKSLSAQICSGFMFEHPFLSLWRRRRLAGSRSPIAGCFPSLFVTRCQEDAIFRQLDPPMANGQPS